MKYFIYGFMFVLTSVAVSEAKAQAGNDLFSYDDSTQLSYIMGVADAQIGTIWCQPGKVSYGQIHRMVKKFMLEHPESLHHEANFIIGHVLSSAFPCKEEASKTELKY